MSNAIGIEFPQAQADALFRQIIRAEKELGKDLKESVQWAGILLVKSLAKDTKKSPKMRPIIKRPRTDPNYARAKNDSRFAPFGVKRWNRAGKEYFQGIYRTGEFGKLRYFDKKTVAWFDRSGGSGRWRKIQSGYDTGNPEILVPGIKTDKRRIIGNSGFAKKTWQWASTHMSRGGSQSLGGIPNITNIKWAEIKTNPTVTIRNRVSYMDKALRGGYSAIGGAMSRAASGMANRINKKIEKRMLK